MTCLAKDCGYEFCWVCLGDWKEHCKSGQAYKCNSFEVGTKNIEKERTNEQKFIFYFERFKHNDQGQKIAKKMFDTMADKISSLYKAIHLNKAVSIPALEFDFLYGSAKALEICRSYLKWTWLLH